MHLLAHPASPPGPVLGIEADARPGPGACLCLSFRLAADLSRLRIPAPAAVARADGLWRHSCFEAFLAIAGRPGYVEFNFSPSGAWAAYAFIGYRAGMTSLALPSAPEARWQRAADRLELGVTLAAPALAGWPAAGPLRLALAAVVEDHSGTMSWWALRHPRPEPDFHHPDGFALELAGAVAGGGAHS